MAKANSLKTNQKKEIMEKQHLNLFARVLCLVAFVLVGTLAMYAQPEPPQVYKDLKCAVQPSFPNEYGTVVDYVKSKIVYPERADMYAMEGKVIMQFVVEKDGSIGEITPIRTNLTEKTDKKKNKKFASLSAYKQQKTKELIQADFEREAARIIGEMPKWNPGKDYVGEEKVLENIRVKYTLPVDFKMKE